MSEIISKETTANSSAEPVAKPAIKPPAQNPAVTRCIKAWNRAYKNTPKRGPAVDSIDDFDARRAADAAFCAAMPDLIGVDNIRDFVACVAYGMHHKTIERDLGTKLLYASQVAYYVAKKFKSGAPHSTE